MHAQQRISLFNFFVVFSSLATTALVGTFHEKTRAHVVGVGLGVLLIFISFIFWMLDERVRFLIKHAEHALKWIETKYEPDDCGGRSDVLRLFTCEEAVTSQERPLTYSKCFQWTFLVFGLVGLIGAIVSAAFWGVA